MNTRLRSPLLDPLLDPSLAALAGGGFVSLIRWAYPGLLKVDETPSHTR